MADNVTLPVMSGGDTLAADDVGGIKYQRFKLSFGADGAATDVATSAPLPVSVATAASLGSGAVTLTLAGTIQQLPNQAATGITVRALTTNAGTVYVGGSAVTASNGFPLNAGEALSLDVANTNAVYLTADTDGQAARFVWVTP